MKQLKKIELATYDVAEMNRQELMAADGGTIFQDAWYWTKNAANDAGYWCKNAVNDAADWISTAADDAWSWYRTHCSYNEKTGYYH